MKPRKLPNANFTTTPREVARFRECLEASGTIWPGVLELLTQLEDAKSALERIDKSHHHPRFHKDEYVTNCPGCIAHLALFPPKSGDGQEYV